ncbi:MAG: molybdopterin-dependent oxidoreductase, partial [Saprospiraceae bacterium]|nr:molybdopterin-dependent oxidoreductase [Saprospiraceae bacterium]
MSGLTGTVLCLGYYFPAIAGEAKILNAAGETIDIELNAWIRIDTAGKVTIFSHRAEMGQGAYQAIPQMVAEELEVLLEEVNILFAPGNNKKYGNQITGGSSTVRNSYKNLLNLSASAREMLIEVASKRWSVPKTACYAEAGHVLHRPSGKKFHYGELVEEASKLEVPKDIK